MLIYTTPPETQQQVIHVVRDNRGGKALPQHPPFYERVDPPLVGTTAEDLSGHGAAIQIIAASPDFDADIDSLIAPDLANSMNTSFTLYEVILNHWFYASGICPAFKITPYHTTPFGGPALDLAVTPRNRCACAYGTELVDDYFPEGEPIVFIKLFEPDAFASDVVRPESLALTRDAHAAVAPYMSRYESTLVICAFGRRWRASLMPTLLSGDVTEIMPEENDTGWMDDVVSEASYDVLGRLVGQAKAMWCSTCDIACISSSDSPPPRDYDHYFATHCQ
ncbi:hypothetical protein BD626DRAFT_563623 [Schizophyllum amplum]|uniref:Uncharacterized protein n=1 Tax=Schizophyllum amplum TaxID=97359 RepID=A0A550CYT1_9AGAR|nr:hypothetical protein BD626DRAFT_563623 [Auriculariopsis ampla]